jgi:hypothetical protein
MRLLFFILLLLNAGLLAYFLLQPSQEASSLKPHPALRPESLRLPNEHASADAVRASGAGRACVEWSGLQESDVAKARDALEKLGAKDKLILSANVDYWVYIPPLKSIQEAEKKIGELKALGIEDGTVVRESGKWQNAVSLATFATPEEAEFYLKQLRDKGVKSAKSTERQAPSTALTLVDVDAALREQLDQLTQEFDKTELKSVECSVR